MAIQGWQKLTGHSQSLKKSEKSFAQEALLTAHCSADLRDCEVARWWEASSAVLTGSWLKVHEGHRKSYTGFGELTEDLI